MPIELMQIIQTVAILAGLAVMIAKVGGREQLLRTNTQMLSELRDIVTDLAQTVTVLATKNDHVERQLHEIKRRLQGLEDRERESKRGAA
jgi:hypothetical protein